MATRATHAIVVRVTFKPGLEEAAAKVLDTEVVPGAKAASGFIAGYWMHSEDGTQGHRWSSSTASSTPRPR